jgi:tryptophan halogenase
MRINKIVIVGGGSSGWMTAAALCKNFPDMDVTLIESKDIKTMGVGESTLGQFNNYLQLIGLTDDSSWMKECDATYKVSIKFTDFRETDTVFQYPFGIHGADRMQRGLDAWPILRQIDPEYHTLDKFAKFYNPISYLSEKNKLTKNEDGGIPNFFFEKDTAYHLDATKFGIYLKNNICLPSGMTHIVEDVVDVCQKEDGEVDYILTESGQKLTADLFIDCTGFKSLLLEEKMGSKFISFGDTLLNDRALATKIPYSDPNEEMENTTNCTAIENGWVWNIPLWSRIGSGYVYSSKFVSRDQAEIEFRNHLKKTKKNIPDDLEMKEIFIRHGKREKAWVKNVLGIGLSYGFIEPLESTGLLTTHDNIFRLVKTLTRRNRFVSGIDKSIFNTYLDYTMDGVRSFIETHYGLSMREDTDYWKHVTSIEYHNEYDVQQLEINIFRQSNFNGLIGGMPYIAAGMGYLPTYKVGRGLPGSGELPYEEIEQFKNINREFKMFHDTMVSYVNGLPTHYQFLKETIYQD